jgi:3-phytase
MKKIVLLLVFAMLLVIQVTDIGIVGAIDTALCADDGVTEIPWFATRDDVTQCLMIDPGNGDPPIPMQYEFFHEVGVQRNCDKSNTFPTTTIIDTALNDYGNCPTQDGGEYCSMLLWNTTFDGYIDPGCKNEDIIERNAKPALEYFYFKDSVVANGWPCKGSFNGWVGPESWLRCGVREDTESHSDGIQLRKLPANDGWWIMQDTIFVNGYNLHLLMQETKSGFGRLGSVLWQGVFNGRIPSIGLAEDWVADCLARGDGLYDDQEKCVRGKSRIDNSPREVWFIDVAGQSYIGLKGSRIEKVVVINTGCDKTGCDGTIGYHDGFPWPLAGSGTSDTPGNCPNGYIGNECTSGSTPCYCYTSIEKMQADTTCSDCPHKSPPFIHLSDAGWENPPNCGNGVTEGSEECDDGNTDSGDGCSSDCKTECTLDSQCDDGNVCTLNTCNTVTNLCNPPAGTNEGQACTDDGQFCTGTETCQSGRCASSGNPCTSPSFPVCNEDSNTCIACSQNSDCNDDDECTDDICSGACTNTNSPSGTPCTIGNCDGLGNCLLAGVVTAKRGPLKYGGSADDPAIWIHPTDSSKSLIFVSDKSDGISAFRQDGTELQRIDFETRLNNIDVREGFQFGGQSIDILAANLRDAGKLAVMRIDPGYDCSGLSSCPSPPMIVLADHTSSNNDISSNSYGFTLYKSQDGTLYAFDKAKGTDPIIQWRVDEISGEIRTTNVRQINDGIGTAEGFVADDALGHVYFAEEAVAVHKYPAEPSGVKISTFAIDDGISGDREGMALYACNDGTGYLLLSSQGNDQFKVYEREGSNAFVKSFETDNSFGADGLDVSSHAIPGFQNGFAVIHNELGSNYFMYDWADIAAGELNICAASCQTNSDCDDGSPCNGLETCSDSSCQPGTPPACGLTDGCCPGGCSPSSDTDCVSVSCLTTTSSWQNNPIPPQTGSFTVEYDATPNGNDLDAIVALSNGEGFDYPDFATLTRFYGTGIDSRDYDTYRSDNTIPYSAGTSYHFLLEVDVTSHTYNIFVTPENGSRQTVGTGYTFRKDQDDVPSLDNWAIWSGQGSIEVCNFIVSSGGDYHRADTSKNGCIDGGEIGVFIGLWYADSTDVSMVELVRALEIWKAGC